MSEKDWNGKPSIDKPWLKYYTDEQKNTPIPKMSVYDYLLECNRQYKGRVALNYFNRKITYEELFNNIDKVAVALTQKGVKKGNIITVQLLRIGNQFDRTQAGADNRYFGHAFDTLQFFFNNVFNYLTGFFTAARIRSKSKCRYRL